MTALPLEERDRPAASAARQPEALAPSSPGVSRGRAVLARFVLEYCRPDPDRARRPGRPRELDPQAGIGCSGEQLVLYPPSIDVALQRIVGRLDVPARDLRPGFATVPVWSAAAEGDWTPDWTPDEAPVGQRRISDNVWLLGPSARPDLDGDRLVPLCEVEAPGVDPAALLEQLREGLANLRRLPPPRQELPFLTAAELDHAIRASGLRQPTKSWGRLNITLNDAIAERVFAAGEEGDA